MVDLTPGVKYHVSVYVNMLDKTGTSQAFRLTTNGANSGAIGNDGRVDYVFTAGMTSHGILVTLSNCSIQLANGICVEDSQWSQLQALGLAGNFFNGDTMPQQ